MGAAVHLREIHQFHSLLKTKPGLIDDGRFVTFSMRPEGQNRCHSVRSERE